METKANHLIVGAFVLAMLGAVFGFIYWMQNYVNGGASKRYDVIFSGSVQGLSEASAVLFNGLRVGTVKELGILPTDTAKVKVVITVADDTPIRENSHAEVLQQGLAGWVAVALTPGTPDSAFLKAKPGEAYPTIYADDTGSGSIMSGVPEAVGNANALFVRLNTMIADNQKLISSTAQNVESFTAMLKDNKDNVATIIDNARQLSVRFNTLADKLDHAVDQVSGQLTGGKDSAVVQAQQAAQSFHRLAEKLEKSLGDQAGGLTYQAKRSMREFELFMADGRRLAENLDRLVQKVDANPSALIFGGSQVPEYKPGQQ